MIRERESLEYHERDRHGRIEIEQYKDRHGDADALVAGVGQHYPETIRPALQMVQTREGVSRVAGSA
jgi:hypothetical protein